MATSRLLPPVQGPPPNDPLPGMTLGDYKVERAIAAGGMGIVYVARHPLLGKKAAVKVLRQEYARNQEQIERFLKEAQAVSAIHHRGIIDVITFGTIPGDGRQYMVMEYLDGETLEQLLSRDSPMHANRALPIIDEILDALSAAHQVGVVHRDLKPSNVFVTLQSNGARYCKLVDFGLAKQYAFTGNEAPAFAKASLVAGTPEYISPEQARGLAATPRTDLYCTGVILFEMLTGGLPFTAPSLMELLQKQVYEKAPRVSQFIEVPESLDGLVAALLEKDPEARPRSADVARQAIARILKEMKEASTQYVARPLPLKRLPLVYAPPQEDTQTSGANPLAREGQPGVPSPDKLGAAGLPDTLVSDREPTTTDRPQDAREVKSDGRGKRAPEPGPLPPEVKSDGRGKRAPEGESPWDSKSDGRGKRAPDGESPWDSKGDRTRLASPAEVKSDGRGKKAPEGAWEAKSDRSKRGLDQPTQPPEVKSDGRGKKAPEEGGPWEVKSDRSKRPAAQDTPPELEGEATAGKRPPERDTPPMEPQLEVWPSSPTLPRSADTLRPELPVRTESGIGGPPDRRGLRLLAFGLAAVGVAASAALIWLADGSPEPSVEPAAAVASPRVEPPKPAPVEVVKPAPPEPPPAEAEAVEPPPRPSPLPGKPPRPRAEQRKKTEPAKKQTASPREAARKQQPAQPETASGSTALEICARSDWRKQVGGRLTEYERARQQEIDAAPDPSRKAERKAKVKTDAAGFREKLKATNTTAECWSLLKDVASWGSGPP